MNKKKLLFIVNVDWFFISHRLPIALEAIKDGYDVHIATSITDKMDLLEASGLIVHPLNLHRSRSRVGSILSEFWQILSIIRLISPSVLHLVTIKPVLLGGMAARFVGSPAVVSAVSGLGFVFVSKGIVAKFRRKVVTLLYRLALGHSNQMVIFQNSDDQARLSRLMRLSAAKTVLIPGSGVDLSLFYMRSSPPGVPVIMFAGRFLVDKGLREFVHAAELVGLSNHHARFVIVGTVDPLNPASIQQGEVDQWKLDGTVEVLGYRDDMEEVLSLATMVVFPSYSEGFPKVLIEAAACGRAVITTNVSGCRDAIQDGITGMLVPVGCVDAIVDAIVILLENPARCRKMGAAGRRLAEEKFGVNLVTAKHMEIYRDLLIASE